MTTLTPERLAELRSVAEAATQGEWAIDAPIGDWGFAFVCFIVPKGETSANMREIIAEIRGGEVDPMPNTANSKLNRRAASNAAHIAAFDPPTALALLAALAEAQTRLARIDATNSEAGREAKDILRESNMFRAERDDARGERNAYMKSYAGCVADRDRLAAQVGAMREAMGQIQQMAEYDLDKDLFGSNTWQIEADARTALAAQEGTKE